MCIHLDFTAAGFVALLYDILLTLDDEIAYVWQQKASFAKTLYLANKYIVTAMLLFVTVRTCVAFLNEVMNNQLSSSREQL